VTARTKGVLCLVASAFGFAAMAMFVHLADLHGAYISSFQKSFFRNVVAALLAGGLFLRRRAEGPVSCPRAAWGTLLGRSVFGTLGIFGTFYALSHIPIGDAMALNKLAPFFTVIFSWLFLGERFGLRQFLCILVAFAGSLCVVKPGFGMVAPGPALGGLASGVCAGAAYAFVRKLGLMRVDGAAIVLFFSVFSCCAALPFLVFDWHPMTSAQLLILTGAGGAAAIGQFGVTAAYRFAPPREIAAFDYTNILFTALFGFLVFDQIPDLFSGLGFLLIAGSAILMRRV